MPNLLGSGIYYEARMISDTCVSSHIHNTKQSLPKQTSCSPFRAHHATSDGLLFLAKAVTNGMKLSYLSSEEHLQNLSFNFFPFKGILSKFSRCFRRKSAESSTDTLRPTVSLMKRRCRLSISRLCSPLRKVNGICKNFKLNLNTLSFRL